MYLDLSKAFDTVYYEILLYKLDYYGIRGHICKWFRHYLSDRQQCVSINGTVSEYFHVQPGVPQGSILRPVLFLLYINDISNAADNVFCVCLLMTLNYSLVKRILMILYV